jgi:hypothetical protein
MNNIVETIILKQLKKICFLVPIQISISHDKNVKHYAGIITAFMETCVYNCNFELSP